MHSSPLPIQFFNKYLEYFFTNYPVIASTVCFAIAFGIYALFRQEDLKIAESEDSMGHSTTQDTNNEI